MSKKLIKLFAILLLLTAVTKVHALEGEEDTELVDESEQTEFVDKEEDDAEGTEEDEEPVETTGNYVNKDTQYALEIIDEADLFTSDEEEKLRDQMTELTKYGNIILITLKSNYTTTSSYASQYYKEHYGTESGSVLIIDMDNRKIYIFSDGANYRIITGRKATSITDNVYTYATNEEYYECAKEAFTQMKTLLEGGKIAEPMRHISNLVFAITAAFSLNFLFVLFCSTIKKASSKEVLNNCNIKFEIGTIEGTVIGEHRVYNPHTESSGGGFSGGGGGGGGGSSGGGGGHSF